MDEEKVNKKNYEYDNYSEYDTEEDEYYLNDDCKEKIEEEYFSETTFIIQKNILGFVENKSLPLCEYLDYNSIKNFIIDNIEY